MFMEMSKIELEMGMGTSLAHITTLNQIATALSRLGEHEEAILHLRQCLEIAQDIPTE